MDSGQWMDTTHIISRTPMEAAELMWPHARVFDYNTGSNRAASVKATGQGGGGGGGGVSAAIWVNGRIWIHGRIQTRNSDLSLYRASCIEHRASFAGSICHTPPPWKAPCGFYAQFQVRMLCKKEVRKSEFCGIRPLTTNNLLRVHHCLLPLLLGWLTGEGRFYLRIRYSGTRYQVPGSLRFRAVPGTWYLVCKLRWLCWNKWFSYTVSLSHIKLLF